MVDGSRREDELHRRLLRVDLNGPAAALRRDARGGGRRSRRVTILSLRPAFPRFFESCTTTRFATGAEQTVAIFIVDRASWGVTSAVGAIAGVIGYDIAHRRCWWQGMGAARVGQRDEIDATLGTGAALATRTA